MAARMKIKLVQTGPVKFVARNAAGAIGVIDGPTDQGGENAGLRPMETLLFALAGCSSLDVLHIMKKQRQHLERLEVEVDGERLDAVPAVFKRIHLRFKGYGQIDIKRFQKAIDLSMEKYCSVSRMLEPKVTITAEGVIG